MPQAVLRFKLPEENEEYKDAINGVNWHILVQNLDDYLRTRIKYETLSEEVQKTLQEIRDVIYDGAYFDDIF